MRGKPCPLCGGTGFLDPRYKLTGAEQRAIREVARGYTQKEAAFHLGIKPKTIKDTLIHVYRKVGVNSTQEAIYVLWLREHFGET